MLVPALAYASGWVLMIAAMMLPTTLPVLRIFRRLVVRRPQAAALYALVIGGYLCAWMGFGLAAHLLDSTLHAAARETGWFTTHGWILGAAAVAAAGAFQFSTLKYHCLDKCRTPYGFVVQRWQGRSQVRESWRIGWDHGLFCVGCCWALMLLMFVIGSGNLGWMLALGLVMGAEKNLRSGRRLSAPLGWALLVWAAGITAAHLPGVTLAPL